MDATLLNLGTATTSTGLNPGTTPGTAAPASPSGLESFAGIFNRMQPPTERQDLAAWPQGLQMPSLVAQPLGQGLSVITPDAPSPGPDSLLAFARSQGLDEQAIAALWQTSPVNAASTGPGSPVAGTRLPELNTGTPVSVSVGLTTNASLQSAMGALLGAAHGAQALPLPAHPALSPQDPNASTSADAGAAPQAFVPPAFLFTAADWTQPGTPSPSPSPTTPAKPLPSQAIQPPQSIPPSDASPDAQAFVPPAYLFTAADWTPPSTLSPSPIPTAKPLPSLQVQAPGSPPLPTPPAAMGLQAQACLQLLNLAIQATPVASTRSAAAEPTAPQEPDPLTLSQLKVQIAPPQWRPARAQANTGTNEVAPPVWSQANKPKDHSGEADLLDLEADLLGLVSAADGAPEALSSAASATPTAAPTPSSTPSANTSSNPLAAAAAPASDTPASAEAPRVISGFQLKADHYQQLADRMGQALAQRLQQQIDRGEWSLRLRLNPAELGQIDVQLDMQQSGLNAVFQADNPLTRDLIQQGSGRLREGLAQSGMTVASVWVNSNGSGQSGGNPTPQQQRRRSSSPAPAVGSNPTPATASRISDNSWDMLA